jgi:hypothetical protein
MSARTSLRRRWKWLLTPAVIAALPVLYLAWTNWRAEGRLAETIAEADLLDPHWTWVELQDPIPRPPDAENTALQLIRARKLVPANWFAPPAADYDMEDALRGPLLTEPWRPLTEAQRKYLDRWLKPAEPALTAARALATMPNGRFPIVWKQHAMESLMPDVDDAGPIGQLLWCACLRHLDQGDPASSLECWRAWWNAGRAAGVERTFWPLVTARLPLRDRAIRGLERMLAWRTLPEADLADLQRRLEEDTTEPILVHALRGDRAQWHQDLLAVGQGTANRRFVAGMVRGGWRSGWEPLDEKVLQPLHVRYQWGNVAELHATWLHWMNRLIVAAKRPAHEQPALVTVLEAEQQPLSQLARDLTSGPLAVWRCHHGSVTHLRCAVAAVACERFRLARGRWPVAWAEVMPAYLAAPPLDPWDGRPLRLRPTATGLVIYSVGPDCQDDGGRLYRNPGPGPKDPGWDLGFQLWTPPRPPVVPEAP